MSAAAHTIEAEVNHAWLVSEFVGFLFQSEPRSVLDVGCGSGRVLRACQEAGVEVAGVDRAGPALEALRAEGLDVRAGTAYALDVQDRSVDWVTLRHVPHHLEDPSRAFAEALRVARVGVLVAEPWFDTSLDSQRGALDVDRWEKRQHRRSGMFHAESLDLDALLRALPADVQERFELETRRSLRLGRRSVATFARESEALVEHEPEAHPERVALAELLTRLERTGLTWNGSLCLSLRRSRGTA